jgi:glutamate---cysteine ligase / carboxylate-amine ligase
VSRRRPLRLFEGYGIELEYMLVDRETLAVLPASDRILRSGKGRVVDEVDAGPLRWSNELALHVVELKTNGPVSSFRGLAETISEHVGRVNRLLEPIGGRLMPTAMHPLMDPAKETRIWRHGRRRRIFQAYDRIFGCSSHGFANLQCVHVNLPFTGDVEFARLHAAVRLVLPILPALAASSPVVEGEATGLLDNRLEAYRTNQRRIPSIAGSIIPEQVSSRQEYRERILAPVYRDLAPHDPDGVLRHEWINSRGAIARFERSTIEIRLLDAQECPAADLAVASLVVAALRALTAGRLSSPEAQAGWEVEPLERLLRATVRDGEAAAIEEPRYLGLFGYPGGKATAGELWRHLARTLPEEYFPGGPQDRVRARTIVEAGPLARRILRALGGPPSPGRIRQVYGELCDRLESGTLFLG